MTSLYRLSVLGSILLVGMLDAPIASAADVQMTASLSEPGSRIDTSRFHLIPMPRRVEPQTGGFPLSDETAILISDPADAELQAIGEYTAAMLSEHIGFTIELVPDTAPSTRTIRLSLDRGITPIHDEGYRLEVSEASISITAGDYAGLFYGIQTLRQLTSDGGTVPAIAIEDQPRFVYRGMHLDVGRHFFPVSFIKRYIDLMSMYKMNTFHWHLTEDQGWRIEIQQYPKLTEIGAYRSETILEKNFDPYIGDGIPYGGYYTQDEVREVVDYARQRYVTVIPEIELPGHSTAALAAYPELACTDGPFDVSTKWGVHLEVYCPKEDTFQFLENVLSEVMQLFPSRYIHIGGDEVFKTRWEESDLAQSVIRREGLADEHELQSYFIKRIEAFLLANGRRLIGWDEILEGGLAPEATVMSWRGMEGGIEAARQGHDVIMTPTSHVYFDYYQGDQESEPLAIGGFTPLEKVYAFEPVPDELTNAEAARVLGAQGNVWTEYIKTERHVEYMVFPRMLALAEVVWSPAEVRNWDSFKQRLPTQLEQLDKLGVNYRREP